MWYDYRFRAYPDRTGVTAEAERHIDVHHDCLHEISRRIVEDAEERNAVIVVGLDVQLMDDDADKNGALNIGKRASGKFSKPPSEAGAVLAQPETQVIVQRDDEPANLPLLVDPTPSGGSPRLAVGGCQARLWGDICSGQKLM